MGRKTSTILSKLSYIRPLKASQRVYPATAVDCDLRSTAASLGIYQTASWHLVNCYLLLAEQCSGGFIVLLRPHDILSSAKA
jgi:hypothetical protein